MVISIVQGRRRRLAQSSPKVARGARMKPLLSSHCLAGRSFWPIASYWAPWFSAWPLPAAPCCGGGCCGDLFS